MKLSVVTVVFNDVNHIEKTINSVLSQTYKDIEYIIIDGQSNDGTVDIIKKYDDKIDLWISEPDKGLYDAMNKALDKATGDYVIFLNSGDVFFDETTVEKIFQSAKNKNPDVIYGETLIVDENDNPKGLRRLKTPEKLTWKSFKKGMLVSHQAFIPKLELCPHYDLNYKYSADYDWCIKILKKSGKIHNSKQIIVKFLDGGLTKKRLKASLKERFRIMKKYYGLPSTLFTHFVNGIKLFFFYVKKRWY